ncbi:helix-turn-helix domain-containing protein [Kitasatospora sp. NPDC056327]|uniref:helix-turn-helix domain-containing protein n=1 Tax=Kitasatospora sp. NPDC056327 TaxID=3345785 RepID=UPI0035D5F3B7
MGRRENRIDPGAGPLERFAHDLRMLRRLAGSPSYQQLAAHTHFAPSTLAACASGKRLPSPAVLAAYVTACGGDPAAWEERRVRTRVLLDLAADDDSGGGSDGGGGTGSGKGGTGDGSTVGHDRTARADQAGGPARSPASAGGRIVAVTAPAAMDGDSGWSEPVLLTGGARRPPARPAPYGPATPGGVRRLALLVLALLCAGLSQAGAPPAGLTVSSAARTDYAHWFSTAAAVPHRFRPAIVRAGTSCSVPQITPALIAAILATESGFDPELADPVKQEYGIARWTPRVLRYYLPEEQQDRVPVPPLDAEESILALGRILCTLAPQLEGVAGDPVMNLAAAYRTATYVVQKEDGVPARLRPYTDRVRGFLMAFAPPGGACLPFEVPQSSYPAPCSAGR